MDNDLLCNFKKCRKRLDTVAWVTACSHIFCDEDGTREFGKSHCCPACDSSLDGKYDIIRIDMQPSEQYKSMVLAGQKPEAVIEIASRALSFWNYQMHQERMYQEHVSTKSKEKAAQLETYYAELISRTKAELASLKTQLHSSRKEFETLKKKYGEVSEQLKEKGRLYGKLQAMYDVLRRKSITPQSFDSDPPSHTPRHANPTFMTTRNDVLKQSCSDLDGRPANDPHGRAFSPTEREFNLRPISTPTLPVEKFNLGLGDHAQQHTPRMRQHRL